MEKQLQEDLLESIHDILKLNHQVIPAEKREELDQRIIPMLEKLEIEEEYLPSFQNHTRPKIKDPALIPYVYEYYAMAKDNEKLYERLKEEHYPFTNQYINMGLFVLDKEFSSLFSEEEYLTLLSDYNCNMKLFYDSVRKLPEEEKLKFYQDYRDLICTDSTLLQVPYGNNQYGNLVTKKNLEQFGKDFLLELSLSQRQLLASLPSHFHEQDVIKAKQLITEYPTFHLTFPMNLEIFRSFSVEEIVLMEPYVYEMLMISMKRDSFPRVKQLLKLNPDFRCPLEMIRYEILHVLDDDEIFGLSEEAKQKLSLMKIPHMHNVSIFPVLKINQIVLADKVKRKMHGTHK